MLFDNPDGISSANATESVSIEDQISNVLAEPSSTIVAENNVTDTPCTENEPNTSNNAEAMDVENAAATRLVLDRIHNSTSNSTIPGIEQLNDLPMQLISIVRINFEKKLALLKKATFSLLEYIASTNISQLETLLSSRVRILFAINKL